MAEDDLWARSARNEDRGHGMTRQNAQIADLRECGEMCVNPWLGSLGDACPRGARVKGPIVILKGSIDYDNDVK